MMKSFAALLTMVFAAVLAIAPTAATADSWSSVVTSGFSDTQNISITDLFVFKSAIYAGTYHGDTNPGELYKSTTGAANSYGSNIAPTLTAPVASPMVSGENTIAAIGADDITTGLIYIATGFSAGGATSSPSIYKALAPTGGSSWTEITTGGNGWSNPNDGTLQRSFGDDMVEFNGMMYIGTRADSDTGTAEIWRFAEGSTNTFEKVVDFSDGTGLSGAEAGNYWVTSLFAMDGKLWAGVANANGAFLYSSTDGDTWVENAAWTSVVQDANNLEIPSIAIYSGDIYVTTARWDSATGDSIGGQLWKSADDGGSWTQVNDDGLGDADNQSLSKILGGDPDDTDDVRQNSTWNRLWITNQNELNPSGTPPTSWDGVPQRVYDSVDGGDTFTQSNTDGFGSATMTQPYSQIVKFGDAIYWGGHDGGNTGTNVGKAEVWRMQDVTNPSAPTLQSFSESSPYIYKNGTTLYFKNSFAVDPGPQEFTATVLGSDNGANLSGVHDVFFTTVSATNWSGGGSVSYDGGTQYSMTYQFSGTSIGTPTGGFLARTTDNTARTTANTYIALFTADGTLPTVPTITYAGGNNADNTITFGKGSDASSGLGTWIIQRAEAALDNYDGTCDTIPDVWTDIATNPVGTTFDDTTRATDTCYKYRIVTRDNVSNERITVGVNTQRIDSTVNTNSITSDGSPTNQNSYNVGGTIGDSANDISSVTVTFTGPASGTICTAPTLTPNGVNANLDDWSCNWNITGLADGTYTISARAYDTLNNFTDSTQQKVIDRTAPTASLNSVLEASPYAYYSGSGDEIWFNPLTPTQQNIQVKVNAADAHTGIEKVSFPDLVVAGWSPLGGGDDTVGPTPYDLTYTFDTAAGDPTSKTVTAYDLAGNTNTDVTLDFNADATEPVGGSVTYADGYTTSASINVTFDQGTDTESGVASTQLQRASADLANGICDTFSSFAATVNQASPASDALTTGKCYKYQLVVTDRVGNTATFTSANVVKADSTNPTGALTGPASPNTGTVSVTDAGNLIGDTYSGIASIDVTYDGQSIGTTDGPVCNLVTGPVTCNLDTTTLVDGTYRLIAAVTDNAGNTVNFTRDVVFDKTAPSFVLFAVAGSNYLYYPGAGDVVWYSPLAGSIQNAEISVSATDVTSGLQSITYPDLAATGWTPAGGPAVFISGTQYSFEYQFAPGANDPAAKLITAVDNALNADDINIDLNPDSTAPANPTVTYADGFHTSNNVDVMHTNGVETESGFGTIQLRRRVGDLSGGSCSNYSSWGDIGGNNPALTYNDGTISNANCYQYGIKVADYVANETEVLDIVNEVKVDLQDPTVTYTGPAAGAIRQTVDVNGTASDGESGLVSIDISYTGTEAGAICTDLTPATWSCNWDTTAVGNGPYVLHVVGTDAAGNDVDQTRNVTVDNQAPAISLYSATSPNGYVFLEAPSTVWFNSAQTTDQSADITVTATDVVTAVAGVAFPDLVTAGWTPAGGAGTSGPGNQWNLAYTFAMGAGDPGSANVVATDSAGNTNQVMFDLTPDGAPPFGGSVTYTDGLVTDTSEDITWVAGADAGSGIANRHLWRKEGTLGAGACSGWGAFSDLGVVTLNPHPDSTLQTDKCYMYELRETDNVGNLATYSNPNVIKVDTGLPTGAIDAPTSASRASFNVLGHAEDSGTGIVDIDVTFEGPTNGTICLNAAPAAGWTCPWDTTGLNGTYTIKQHVTDGAGNQVDHTRDVVIDNTAPSGALFAVTNPTANVTYPGSGTLIYYNALVSGGSGEVVVQATDGLSGIQSVVFPDLATANWLGSGSGASAGANLFKVAYTFSAGVSDPAVAAAVVTDGAGNTANASFNFDVDTTPPTTGTITYDDRLSKLEDGQVTFTAGTDGESGTGDVDLYRSQGVLSGGTCNSYDAFTLVQAGATSPYDDTSLTTDHCYKYKLVTYDNVGNSNEATNSNEFKYDATNPTPAITGPTGPIRGTSAITGTSSDAGSGIADLDVTYVGTPSGNICLNVALPASWSCDWDTTGLNGTYLITVTATDNAGNSDVATYNMSVDNTNPTGSFDSFVEQGGSAYQYADASTMYYNPAQAGSFDVKINAADAHSGLKDLVFPDLDGIDTKWSPSGNTTQTPGTSPFTQQYSWTAGAVTPGAINVAVRDLALNSVNASFTVTADSTAPANGSISYSASRKSGETALSIALGDPDDIGGSGLATTQLQRREASLTGGSCQTFGGWGNLGSANPATPYSDTTIADGNCYEYRLLGTDNVGNVGIFTGVNTTKVDYGNPSGAITNSQSVLYQQVAPIAITGTTSDAASGVVDVDVTFDGPDDGTVCTDAATPASWSCNWTVDTLTDGAYVLTATITDAVGNSNTATKNFTVRNAPDLSDPSAALVSLTSASSKVYASGSTVWYDPVLAAPITLNATVNATDADTQIQHVAFPDMAQVGWSPAGGNDTTPDGSNNFSFAYTIANGAVEPGSKNILAVNNANLSTVVAIDVQSDNAAPTGQSLSYLNGGQSTLSAEITYDFGSDADSGIATTVMQRRSATLASGVCGTYGAFANVAPTGSPWSDNNVLAGNCYQYQLIVTDNVGHSTTTTPSSTLKVDNVAPTNIVTLTSASHTFNMWSGDATIDITANGATDAHSGIAGYYVLWDHATTTSVVGTGPVTSASATFTSPALTDATDHYVHVRAVDAAGNLTPTKHLGPFKIDLTLPASPNLTVTVSPFTLTGSSTVTWAATDALGSGLATFDVRVQTSTFGAALGAPTLWKNAVPATTLTGTYPLLPGQSACFTVQSRDVAGNVSGFSLPKCSSAPQKAASLKAVGKWTLKASSGSYGGKIRVASKAGATLQASVVSVSKITIYVTRCPTCGYVDVFMGSAKLKRINTKGRLKKKMAFVVGVYAVPKTGLLKLKAAKTGPLVQIEGVGASPL